MPSNGTVRLLRRRASEIAPAAPNSDPVRTLLPVSTSPVSLDSILLALQLGPSAVRVLPAQRPIDLFSSVATSGLGDHIVLLDLRDIRPTVAYRMVSRVRANGWNGILLIVVAERDLGLVLTAKRFGASDFVLPTMSAAELSVRISAASSTVPPLVPLQLSAAVGQVALDWRSHELVSGPLRAQLTLRELQLMDILISRKGVTTPTGELARLAWGKSSGATRALAASYVCSLRKKLAAFGGDFGVKTVRGVGYRFELVTH